LHHDQEGLDVCQHGRIVMQKVKHGNPASALPSRILCTTLKSWLWALANFVDSVIGRKVQRVEWSVPSLIAELADDSTNSIQKYRVVFAKG
jgi:hypothetical protein